MIPESLQDRLVLESIKHHMNDWVADEYMRRMRAILQPKLAAFVPDLYYPNGCPVLSEGPQKDDL